LTGRRTSSPHSRAAGAILVWATAVVLFALIIVWSPERAMIVLAAGLAAVVLSATLLMRPSLALVLSVPLVWLAATKFRIRDPSATLSGDIDAQIFFELIAYAFVAAASLRAILAPDTKRVRARKFEILLISYGTVCLLSTVWSQARSVTLVRSSQWLVLLLLALALVRRFGATRSLSLLGWTTIAYVVFFGLLRAVAPSVASGPGWVTWGGVTRFTWFGVHPGMAAMAASLGILFLFSRLAYKNPAAERRAVVWAYVLLIIGLCTVLLATRSRTELIACTTACAVLFVRRYFSHSFSSAAILGLIGTGCIAALFGNPLQEFFADALSTGNPIVEYMLRGQTASQLTGLSGRTELWPVAISMVSERPIFGYGYLAGLRAQCLDPIVA
jgi:O-antigen ligase